MEVGKARYVPIYDTRRPGTSVGVHPDDDALDKRVHATLCTLIAHAPLYLSMVSSLFRDALDQCPVGRRLRDPCCMLARGLADGWSTLTPDTTLTFHVVDCVPPHTAVQPYDEWWADFVALQADLRASFSSHPRNL